MNRKTLLLILLILSAFLSACQLSSKLYVKNNQKWDMQVEILYDTEEFTETLNEIVLYSGSILEDMELPPDLIYIASNLLDDEFIMEHSLKQLTSYYNNQGIDTTWRNSSRGYDRVFILEAEGRKYEQIEQLAPGLIEVTEHPDQSIEIIANFTEVNQYMVSVIEETIEIRGKEILTANAPVIKKTSAIWRNPRLIEVQLIPGSSLNLFGDSSITLSQIGLLCTIIITVFGGGILIIKKYQRNKKGSEWPSGNDWGDNDYFPPG